MRNPWVHDDMSDAASGGYDGNVRLLAVGVWGVLAAAVGGFVLLSAGGFVDIGTDGAALQTAVTSVVAGVTFVLLVPLLLKLLTISRLLATVAFAATALALGRFVWEREAGRIERLAASGESLDGSGAAGVPSASAEKLVDLLDVLFGLVGVV
ncbi:hypothetical protein [Halorubrum laminariae]|uniref:Uncharacterized protein n=1 Tax=Halorubrum laminariae TaxID=1433523 RepID=A0ABD6BVR5_9EURY|nr:hypothetical protein [Halorubrum laminariae]